MDVVVRPLVRDNGGLIKLDLRRLERHIVSMHFLAVVVNWLTVEVPLVLFVRLVSLE